MENKDLVLDLVEWIAERPRTYEDVMQAWRSTCPRLTIWEDALDAGLVRLVTEGSATFAHATDTGREFLRESGR